MVGRDLRTTAVSLMAALGLILAGCGDSATTTTAVADTGAGTPATQVTSTTPSVATTLSPATTVPATTAAPTTVATEPPPFVTLDDGRLALEPPDTSYRATLLFTMTRVLSDGTVQMGFLDGDGGKIIDPDTGSVAHSFVVDVHEFATIPDCPDIAAFSPNWISVYDTFYGEDSGDLTGDAFLSEAGIMSNGVLVDRYAITLDNVDPEDLNEYESFTEAYVDIARDGGHMVRLVLSGLGFNNSFNIDQGEARDIAYELDFLEFGTITEFSVPEGCLPN